MQTAHRQTIKMWISLFGNAILCVVSCHYLINQYIHAKLFSHDPLLTIKFYLTKNTLISDIFGHFFGHFTHKIINTNKP